MASILRGNDLRQLGFPEGRAIGLALAQLQRKELKRLAQAEQLEALKAVLANPTDFLTHLGWSHVAAALLPPVSRHIELVARKGVRHFRG
jgi:tRNA-splicing ligase RtcB